jgi:hypothetical protein
MNSATIYVSEKLEKDDRKIPFKELIPLFKDYFKGYCDKNSLQYNGDKEILFKNTKVNFGINYCSSIGRYFLSFYPMNIWDIAYKKVLIPAFKETIEFFDTLPTEISIGDIKFLKVTSEKNIDVSQWAFSTDPDVGKNKLNQISSNAEIKSLGSALLKAKHGTIKKKPIIIDAGGITNRIKLTQIKDKISPLFSEEIEIITNHQTALELIENRSDKNNLFVFIFGSSPLIDEYYKKFKRYFISNDIPSQFINVKNVTNSVSWGLENLIFEILKKANNKDAISLDSPHSIPVDGFLCLSDIGEFENNKFFGISISFCGDGSTEDWVELYNDIDYKTEFDHIGFEERELTKLGDKIEALANLNGKTLDVFVSKRWNKIDVGYLCKILEKNNIKVRKFLYISSKSNRFLFSSLEDETSFLYKHPYIIWDGTVASLQTNSKIQLYGTMFPLYVELLNHWTDDKLTETDLNLILWLTKKRIYRIDNFYSLKLPEILALMDELKFLGINNITNRFRISLHSLI